MATALESQIETLWHARDDRHLLNLPKNQQLLQDFLEALDTDQVRVVRRTQQGWTVQPWVKQGILLVLRGLPPILTGGPFPGYDKVPLKCAGWDQKRFEQAGFRMLPGSVVRKGASICSGAVIMPSFINMGAYIGHNTMIDSAVRVGSCAHIGADCHLSDGVGIGGVLEPLQASPVIIEDKCFIGARCQVVEGVQIGEGSVLGMGVTLGASTKIVCRRTGNMSYGVIPPYSVVIPGSVAVESPSGSVLSTHCAIIIKTVDPQTRSKTEINALLRP